MLVNIYRKWIERRRLFVFKLWVSCLYFMGVLFIFRHVGKGLPALKYLSRYLYRGVISEKNIISNHNGLVIFRYTNSDTGKTETRTLKGEDFLHLILQHVLPRGFRRARDYGFLHANAKKLLALVQLILFVFLKEIIPRSRPVFKCPKCQSPMAIKRIRRSSSSGWWLRAKTG